jgi:hypothetical protein
MFRENNMPYHLPAVVNKKPRVRVRQLWISDHEVRRIFANWRISYSSTNAFERREADGIFVREQKTKEGALGYVFYNPLDGQRYIWAIGKRNYKPFKLGKVS